MFKDIIILENKSDLGSKNELVVQALMIKLSESYTIWNNTLSDYYQKCTKVGPMKTPGPDPESLDQSEKIKEQLEEITKLTKEIKLLKEQMKTGDGDTKALAKCKEQILKKEQKLNIFKQSINNIDTSSNFDNNKKRILAALKKFKAAMSILFEDDKNSLISRIEETIIEIKKTTYEQEKQSFMSGKIILPELADDDLKIDPLEDFVNDQLEFNDYPHLKQIFNKSNRGKRNIDHQEKSVCSHGNIYDFNDLAKDDEVDEVKHILDYQMMSSHGVTHFKNNGTTIEFLYPGALYTNDDYNVGKLQKFFNKYKIYFRNLAFYNGLINDTDYKTPPTKKILKFYHSIYHFIKLWLITLSCITDKIFAEVTHQTS